MEDVKEILKGVLTDLKKKQKETDFERVSAAWERIVGAQAAAHTKIVYLTKDKIHVNVDNSAQLFDLNLKKERLRKQLKKTLNIEDIRLKLGQIR